MQKRVIYINLSAQTLSNRVKAFIFKLQCMTSLLDLFLLHARFNLLFWFQSCRCSQFFSQGSFINSRLSRCCTASGLTLSSPWYIPLRLRSLVSLFFPLKSPVVQKIKNTCLILLSHFILISLCSNALCSSIVYGTLSVFAHHDAVHTASRFGQAQTCWKRYSVSQLCIMVELVSST